LAGGFSQPLGPEKAAMLRDALQAYAEVTALARREVASREARATADALDRLLRA
jgi:hypothetical protein